MKYLGIDYGDSHIGFAIGDDDSRFAVPLQTNHNEGFDVFVKDLQALIAEEGIGALVIGIPGMGSVFQKQKEKIELVVERLRAELEVSILTSNESFTSREAQALLREKQHAPDMDEHAIAAMLILQGYFDKQNR